MNSRDKILASLRENHAPAHPLPDFENPLITFGDHIEKLRNVLSGIGGSVLDATDWQNLADQLRAKYNGPTSRILNMTDELQPFLDSTLHEDPRQLENVTVAILKGHFAVAESGAVWITDVLMGDRALPFICEHLVLVVSIKDIYPTLHQAYEQIGPSRHAFGTFIAGPSKTADIEQSLVLGAHGPKSLTLFLLHN